MAILAFQKPENVLMTEATESFAKFEFKPLEPGYAITVGNALRRILLSSLEGYAIASVRIEGVNHEFATIPGVLEDVTNIILNLKQVRFKQIVDNASEETISFEVSKKEVLKAGDINAHLTNFQVQNVNLPICHLDKNASFTMHLRINKGRGYVPAQENRRAEDLVDTLAIDSIYTPIINVKIERENFRVEQKTDYEKLIMEITTDRTIHPREALKQAASILISHFELFTDDTIEEEIKEEEPQSGFDEKTLRIRQLLKTELSEFDLSVRALNCLKSADVVTMGDLVQHTKSDLLKFRNFGKKSLVELEALLEELGIEFGMDISKYKIDNE